MSVPTSPRERACFEAGIKFGSLYHQFAGTPVSPESAASLERAIEESIENQPYCEAVAVSIDPDRLADRVDDQHGYTEWSGDIVDCQIEVVADGVRVLAELVHRDGYPEMTVSEVTEVETGA